MNPPDGPIGDGREPTGHGFTGRVAPSFGVPRQLISHKNIVAVRRNHKGAYENALDALPVRQRDKRTGRFSGGFTDDERERLAALSVFVEQGMYTLDRMVTMGERVDESADE